MSVRKRISVCICLFATVFAAATACIFMSACKSGAYILSDCLYTLVDDHYEITGTSLKTANRVTIEETYEGLPVTAIAASAFTKSLWLEQITVPAHIKSIGKNAFMGCRYLTKVEILSDVKSIEKNTFYGCIALESVNLPASVESIGESAFYNCESLKEIAIPNSVTQMGEKAFYGCAAMTDVTLSENINEIPVSAFSGCQSIKSLTIPGGVTQIGGLAFSGCKSLTQLTINYGVKSIGLSAFGGCTALESVTIPASVTRMEQNAFGGCTNLSSVTLPEFVETVYSNTFSDSPFMESEGRWEDDLFYVGNYLMGCKKEKSGTVNVKEGTTVIAGCAFSDCDSITDVIIPDSVVAIGDEAFSSYKTSLNTLVIGTGVRFIGVRIIAGGLGSAEFKNPSGWRVYNANEEPAEVELPESDVSNSQRVSGYLSWRYRHYCWRRS